VRLVLPSDSNTPSYIKIFAPADSQETREPPNTVRVVWVSSVAGEMFAEKNVGATAEMMQTDTMAKKSGNERYWHSKVGNWAHGVEYAARHQADGVISVPLNPGNLQSELYRDQGFLMGLVIRLLMYPPVNGAYTELFGGLSPDITLSNTGCWGKFFLILPVLGRHKIL
jgi:retinol dehydrogenase-12